VDLFDSVIVDFLQAAARGAMSGKTAMCYLGGACRQDVFNIVVDFL
jgi:hypothetical protein